VRSHIGVKGNENLMRRIGLEPDVLASGCCGLAGDFGITPEHRDVSFACAERVLYPAVRSADDSTLVLADGFSCRTHIASDHSGRRGVHLAEVVAAAVRGDRVGSYPETHDRPMTAATLSALKAEAHTVDLPRPEADGTLAWSATTVVTVTATAGGEAGLGWTYGPGAAASIVDELLVSAVDGRSAFDIPAAHLAMRRATRNAPTAGLATLASRPSSSRSGISRRVCSASRSPICTAGPTSGCRSTAAAASSR
jgi:hypothetical protein